MEKKLVEDNFYIASRDIKDGPFTWGEVKELIAKRGVELQDADELAIYYEPSDYNGRDYSSDASYNILITRPRLETDEEFGDRMASEERSRELFREKRRQNYEKLKAEFEPQN